MATKKKRTLVDDMKAVAASQHMSQEEINETTLKVLDMLIAKLSYYAHVRDADLPKVHVKYGETKPLKPLYTNEGGQAVGFIQQGPRILSIVIEDFIDDGKVKGVGEP